MPLIARHANVVLHAETGSGKTLAYMVPLISRLEPRKPLQLLVLAPSRELALQLAAQVDDLLSPESGLSLSLVVGGVAGSNQMLAAVRQHSELDQAVRRKRAQVLVGNHPSSVAQEA